MHDGPQQQVDVQKIAPERFETTSLDYSEVTYLEKQSKSTKLQAVMSHAHHIKTLEKHRDSLMAAHDGQSAELKRLQGIEVKHAEVSTRRKTARCFDAVTGLLLFLAPCLLGEFHDTTSPGVLWMSSSQLYATGWAVILIAAPLQVIRSVFDA